MERRRRRRPGSIVRATSIVCLTGERQRGIGEAARENDDGSRSSEATGEAGTLSETEQGDVGCPRRTESEHVEAIGSDV
ncbi:hypothetical protein [Arthrobacter sp. Z1-15]